MTEEEAGKEGTGAADGADPDDDETAGWIGVDAKVREGRLLVTTVRRDTPAFDAGVNVGDELLAIDDYRVPADKLEERLKAYRPGDEVTLLVSRRERLTRLPLTLGKAPEEEFFPRPAADTGDEARAARRAWLGDAWGSMTSPQAATRAS